MKTAARTRHRLWVMALVLAIGACSREHVTLDLVEQFPRVTTGVIELGAPEARAHRIEGWSYEEATPTGVGFVWGVGDHSSLRVSLPHPRPITLTLRGWSLSFGGLPPQRVTLRVNGNPAGAFEVGPVPAEYRVAVPADSWVSGENRIELDYAYSRSPADIDPTAPDPRPLAVAWQWLRIEDRPTRAEPHVERNAAALVLPPGSRVEYYTKLEPESVLDVEAITRWDGAADPELRGGEGQPEPAGDGAFVLEVRVESDGVEPAIFDLPVSSGGTRGATRLSLNVESARVARVSLRAVPRETTPRGVAGVRLLRPTIRTPYAPAADRIDPVRPSRPDIVIYLIDTLRADRLGCYGYPRPVSPEIDAFAAEATRFARAMSQAPWTRASVASLFTGLQPSVHGVIRRKDGLAPEAQTLAEILGAAGYQTAALITNGNVAREFGMAQGFESYDYELEESAELNERAFAWLEHHRDGRPFFLYLHAIDPHAPYTPHSPHLKRLAPQVRAPHFASMETIEAVKTGRIPPETIRADLQALYEVEIAFNDENFGALLEKLRALGLYDSSLIVLVADHGEEFYEHGGWEHGETVYGEQLAVPLIVKLPAGKGAGRVVAEPVQLIDLVPTVLADLGLPLLPGLQGRSLLPAILDTAGAAAPVFAHLGLDGREKEAVMADGMKLVTTRVGDRPGPGVELFDPIRDPGEQRNLATEQPIAAAYLLSLLEAEKAAAPAPLQRAETAIPAELEEQLRAIGYLDQEEGKPPLQPALPDEPASRR